MRGVEYAKECRYIRHWICKATAEIVWRRICKVVEVSGRDTWRWEWFWLLGRSPAGRRVAGGGGFW
jgi:hypothetical protein